MRSLMELVALIIMKIRAIVSERRGSDIELELLRIDLKVN